MNKSTFAEFIRDVVIGEIPSGLVRDEETGRSSVIPTAYLSDGSYTGPRDVLYSLNSSDDIPGIEDHPNISAEVAECTDCQIWDWFAFLGE